MIPVAVFRSHGIYLKAKGNPGEPKQGSVNEGCATCHRLKWGLLSPNEVGRITKHVRKAEGEESK